MSAKLKVGTTESDENKSEQRKYCLGVNFSGVFTEDYVYPLKLLNKAKLQERHL